MWWSLFKRVHGENPVSLIIEGISGEQILEGNLFMQMYIRMEIVGKKFVLPIKIILLI